MFKRIIYFFIKRRVYRQTYNELSKLSNRELDDLGIDRYMITRIATETVYGNDKKYI